MNHCPQCKRNWSSGRICPYCDCDLVLGAARAKLESVACSEWMEELEAARRTLNKLRYAAQEHEMIGWDSDFDEVEKVLLSALAVERHRSSIDEAHRPAGKLTL